MYGQLTSDVPLGPFEGTTITVWSGQGKQAKLHATPSCSYLRSARGVERTVHLDAAVVGRMCPQCGTYGSWARPGFRLIGRHLPEGALRWSAPSLVHGKVPLVAFALPLPADVECTVPAFVLGEEDVHGDAGAADPDPAHEVGVVPVGGGPSGQVLQPVLLLGKGPFRQECLGAAVSAAGLSRNPAAGQVEQQIGPDPAVLIARQATGQCVEAVQRMRRVVPGEERFTGRRQDAQP